MVSDNGNQESDINKRNVKKKERPRKGRLNIVTLSVFFSPLEYGITHGSILEMRRDRAKSNESGGEDDVNKYEDNDVSMREKE